MALSHSTILYHTLPYSTILYHIETETHFRYTQPLGLGSGNKTGKWLFSCVCLYCILQDILLYLTYDQLSWEFEPASEEGEDFYSSLWLEFDSVMEVKGKEKKAVSKRVRIFSRQAPMMDAMISRCVADIDQYEVELRKKRVEQGNEE